MSRIVVIIAAWALLVSVLYKMLIEPMMRRVLISLLTNGYVKCGYSFVSARKRAHEEVQEYGWETIW
jgi:hypothetical protein